MTQHLFDVCQGLLELAKLKIASTASGDTLKVPRLLRQSAIQEFECLFEVIGVKRL